MRDLVIDGTRIGDHLDAYVIAELAQNHQGEVQKAKDLIKAAKECGAHAVKLQKRHNRTLYTKALYNSAYDNENSFGATYGEHREALEFEKAEYLELIAYAKKLGMTLFATAWDFKSTDFLQGLNVPAYKVASGDLVNTPLLKHIAGAGKPMIVSTGGATLDDVRRAYDAIMPINSQLCILQCTASYPVEPEEMNLNVIASYRQAFPDVVVGLSDHQNGISMAVAAFVLGARVFEKHFTLNRSWKGTDHSFSLEPIGLKKMIRDLQRVRSALGDGIKRQLPSEARPLTKMRKKIVAARALRAGHRLTARDLALKSPGDGLAPYEWDRVVGKRLTRAVTEDEAISLEVLAETPSRPGPARNVRGAGRRKGGA